MTKPALKVENLSVTFGQGDTRLQAIDNVSLSVNDGEILALVGESGCGKSVTMMAILGLLPKRSGTITANAIQLGDTDLLNASSRELRAIRGRRIGMIFQDPMTSLTPVHRIGFQIGEVLRSHFGLSRQDARRRSLELLDLVRIPDAKRRVDAYPHELSGGMRQRVMIAMALACTPDVLIADEPTTALDVTVQAQVMDLIGELRRDMGMSVVLITHDLGVVAATADRAAVMYAGKIVEEAPVSALFQKPSHGYTAGLIRSLPGDGNKRQTPLQTIPGSVPRLGSPLKACAFAERCAFASAACRSGQPRNIQISPTHLSRCIHNEQVSETMKHHNIVRKWA